MLASSFALAIHVNANVSYTVRGVLIANVSVTLAC